MSVLEGAKFFLISYLSQTSYIAIYYNNIITYDQGKVAKIKGNIDTIQGVTICGVGRYAVFYIRAKGMYVINSRKPLYRTQHACSNYIVCTTMYGKSVLCTDLALLSFLLTHPSLQCFFILVYVGIHV